MVLSGAFHTLPLSHEKEAVKADIGRKLSSVGQDNSDCFMSFPSSCYKFTLTISCSPCLGDGQTQVLISPSLLQKQISVASSLSSPAPVHQCLNLHTLPVFLLYADI